jgi:hypothetical protein
MTSVQFVTTRSKILSAAVVLVAGCSSPPAAVPGSRTAARDASTQTPSAALGDTVRIELGKTASVDDGRLTLRFISRGPDSRCPATVVCVWMGDIGVRLGARVDDSSLERELHTGIEPRSFTTSGYTVSLVGVLPYPGTSAAEGPASTPMVLVVVSR